MSRSALLVALGSLGGAMLAGGCASELDEPNPPPPATGGSGGSATGGGSTTGGVISNTGGAVTTTGGTPAGGAAAGGTPAGGAAAGGAGGMMGGGVPPLAACVKTIFANSCAAICHSTAFKDSFGGLDLSGDAVGERLRNATAQNGSATDKAACGTKLIDADNPANSVLSKRVAGSGPCGPEMPGGMQLSPTDVKCIQDWVNLF